MKQTIIKVFILAIILFLGIISKGQDGFFLTDTTISAGVKIIDNGEYINARLCEVKKGKTIEKYSPDEILSYGFDNDKIFISKEIPYNEDTVRFFLEQLSEGEYVLYYLADKKQSTFFIEKDSTNFFEFPKGNKNDDSYFQNQLQKITSDFPEISTNTKLVKYNKTSLKKFIKEYNNRIDKPFPHLKFGFTGVFEMSKFLLPSQLNNDYLNQLNLKYESSLGGGFFADIPIKASDFSYHTEVLYTKHGYSISEKKDNNIIDFVANISTIKIPALFRYTYPSKKISPFVEAGGIIGLNLNNESQLYNSVFASNTIEINAVPTDNLISEFQEGISLGLGLEYRLNFKNSIFFEIRYNQFSGNNNFKTINTSDIQFITSINL